MAREMVGGPLAGYQPPPEQDIPDVWESLTPDGSGVITYVRQGKSDAWRYKGTADYANPIVNPDPEPEWTPPPLAEVPEAAPEG